MTSDPGQSTGLDRTDVLRLAGLIAALLVLVGVVVLAGGSGGDEGGERGSGQMTGVLTSVDETGLALRTEEGDTQSFEVRPEDRRNLDFFHLRQHAADALPSIVHYDQEGDTLYATRVDDA